MVGSSTGSRESVFALVRDRGSGPVRRVLAAAVSPLERLLGLRRLARVYASLEGTSGLDAFLRRAVEELQIEVKVSPQDLARVPKSGAAVVVSNHPFGGVEGVVLALLMRSIRADVKVLANHILGRIPELAELLVLVDPFDLPSSRRRNLGPLRDALRWLEQGGVLVCFPAGEVAHLDLKQRRVVDPPWSPTIAGLARKIGCPVVPVFLPGRNHALFQIAGLAHPRLRTVLLPRALADRCGSSIRVLIGSPVAPQRLSRCADDDEAIALLRSRAEVLAGREAVQPRRTLLGLRP